MGSSFASSSFTSAFSLFSSSPNFLHSLSPILLNLRRFLTMPSLSKVSLSASSASRIPLGLSRSMTSSTSSMVEKYDL